MEEARLVERLRELWHGRGGPRLGAEGGDHLVLFGLALAQELRPRALLGAELAKAQLAPVREADEDARGAVAKRGALVEDLKAPRRHQVDEEVKAPCSSSARRNWTDGHLPVAGRARDFHAGQRAQRRVERLERHHARRERRLDLRAFEGRADASCRDLDLRKFRHVCERLCRESIWARMAMD